MYNVFEKKLFLIKIGKSQALKVFHEQLVLKIKNEVCMSRQIREIAISGNRRNNC